MPKRGFQHHYSHLLPRKPGVIPLEEVDLVKQCRRCGIEFVTKSRAKKRCNACAELVAAKRRVEANERLQARRKAAREV